MDPTPTLPRKREPPPHLDRGQTRTNTYWHPEKLLRHSDEDGDDDDDDDEPA